MEATKQQASLGRPHRDLALAIYGAAETSPGSYPGAARADDLARSIAEIELAQANDFDTFDARSMLGWERLLLAIYPDRIRAVGRHC